MGRTPIDARRTVVTNDGSDRDFRQTKDLPRRVAERKMIRPLTLESKEGFDLEVVGLSSDERLLVLRDTGESTLLFWEIATEKVRSEFKPGCNAEYSPTAD